MKNILKDLVSNKYTNNKNIDKYNHIINKLLLLRGVNIKFRTNNTFGEF